MQRRQPTVGLLTLFGLALEHVTHRGHLVDVLGGVLGVALFAGLGLVYFSSEG